MKHFFLHDANGKIVTAGFCGDADFALQAQPGLTLRAMAADPLNEFWDGSKLAQKGPQPSRFHVFNYAQKAWQDPRTLAELQAAQWRDVRAARDAQEATSFPYMGKRIDSNLVSVARINAQAKRAEHALANQGQFAIAWTCADNSTLELNAEQMAAMPLALADYAGTLHAKGSALRAEIYAETDAARLAAIKWNADV